MRKLTGPLGEQAGPALAEQTGPPRSRRTAQWEAARRTTRPHRQGQGGAVNPGELYKMLRARRTRPGTRRRVRVDRRTRIGLQPGRTQWQRGDGRQLLWSVPGESVGRDTLPVLAQMLTTAQGSAKAAAQMFASSGLRPWGGYKGVPWSNGTNLQTGVDASGGEVTLAQLEAIAGQH